MNPNLRSFPEGRAAENFPTSPVRGKGYVKRGNDITAVDETETLSSLLNTTNDNGIEAKRGIVEAEDSIVKYAMPTTANGTIISDSNEMIHYPLFVYTSNISTSTKRLNSVLDTTMTQLIEAKLEATDLPEIYESWGTDGMLFGNCQIKYKEQSDLAFKLGEDKILAIPANRHLQVKVYAINSYDTDGERDTTSDSGLSYEWKFSSGEENWEVNVLDKVIGTTSVLDIENIQRGNIGRYTCHISNKWGTIRTKTIYVHVERPGRVVEETREIEGIEFPTGTTIFVETDSEVHDTKYTAEDNKVLWDENDFKFKRVYYDSSDGKWRNEKTKANNYTNNEQNKSYR